MFLVVLKLEITDLRVSLYAVPTAYNSFLSFLLIMSILMFSLMFSNGTIGLFTKYFEPCSPNSSASNAAKITECLGGWILKYSANANNALMPEASSSAPL